jgi:dTDP-glucose pyrophosphorylase
MPLRAALARLEAAGTGALVIADDDGMLLGLMTDGDFRRAVLAGVSLEQPCGDVGSRDPLVAPEDVTPEEALRLMDHGCPYPINHLPLVDAARHACGLLLRSDLVTDQRVGLSAVIMAGGYGTRLRPLTDATPKPMLPVGDRPLLERTIGRLRDAGIHRVDVSTHYLADRITEYFGDGTEFGVDLHYVAEERPLGTAGALALMEPPGDTFLVINGDVVTDVPFRQMLAFHREQRARATIGVRRYDFQVPYGVVESDGPRVRGISEKPRMSCLVNAGVYLFEPDVRRYVPPGARFDMPDLVHALLADGQPIVSFPIVEYWVDIGQPADYERVQTDVREARLSS